MITILLEFGNWWATLGRCYSFRMAITIRTVITELQFINQLASDDPQDKRLAQLMLDAQTDLAIVAKQISGDDPLIRTTRA